MAGYGGGESASASCHSSRSITDTPTFAARRAVNPCTYSRRDSETLCLGQGKQSMPSSLKKGALLTLSCLRRSRPARTTGLSCARAWPSAATATSCRGCTRWSTTSTARSSTTSGSFHRRTPPLLFLPHFCSCSDRYHRPVLHTPRFIRVRPSLRRNKRHEKSPALRNPAARRTRS